MPKKSLEVFLIASQLLLNLPKLPLEQGSLPYGSQTSIYAHPSKEDLDLKLINEADNLATKEQAIERKIDIYGRLAVYGELAVDGGYNERDVNNAIIFFRDIISKSKDGPHLEKAYLYLGILQCCVAEPKNVREGIRYLEKARAISISKKIKIQAIYQLAYLHWYGVGANERGFTLENAKKYFQEIIEIAPQSELAQDSKKILQGGEFQKIK